MHSNGELVLIFGHDAMLLETRRRVLERAGYEACVTQALEETERILSEQEVAVLILCHTLSNHECKTILLAAHALRPNAKCLLLTAPGAGCFAGKASFTFEALQGPKALLATLENIGCKSVPIHLPLGAASSF